VDADADLGSVLTAATGCPSYCAHGTKSVWNANTCVVIVIASFRSALPQHIHLDTVLYNKVRQKSSQQNSKQNVQKEGTRSRWHKSLRRRKTSVLLLLVITPATRLLKECGVLGGLWDLMPSRTVRTRVTDTLRIVPIRKKAGAPTFKSWRRNYLMKPYVPHYQSPATWTTRSITSIVGGFWYTQSSTHHPPFIRHSSTINPLPIHNSFIIHSSLSSSHLLIIHPSSIHH
jgi:hypothetical protein